MGGVKGGSLDKAPTFGPVVYTGDGRTASNGVKRALYFSRAGAYLVGSFGLTLFLLDVVFGKSFDGLPQVFPIFLIAAQLVVAILAIDSVIKANLTTPLTIRERGIELPIPAPTNWFILVYTKAIPAKSIILLARREGGWDITCTGSSSFRIGSPVSEADSQAIERFARETGTPVMIP